MADKIIIFGNHLAFAGMCKNVPLDPESPAFLTQPPTPTPTPTQKKIKNKINK